MLMFANVCEHRTNVWKKFVFWLGTGSPLQRSGQHKGAWDQRREKKSKMMPGESRLQTPSLDSKSAFQTPSLNSHVQTPDSKSRLQVRTLDTKCRLQVQSPDSKSRL